MYVKWMKDDLCWCWPCSNLSDFPLFVHTWDLYEMSFMFRFLFVVAKWTAYTICRTQQSTFKSEHRKTQKPSLSFNKYKVFHCLDEKCILFLLLLALTSNHFESKPNIKVKTNYASFFLSTVVYGFKRNKYEWLFFWNRWAMRNQTISII